jgi:hypothetical protein
LEVASLLGVGSHGFGSIPNRLDFIDAVGGGNRFSSSVVSDERGHMNENSTGFWKGPEGWVGELTIKRLGVLRSKNPVASDRVTG